MILATSLKVPIKTSKTSRFVFFILAQRSQHRAVSCNFQPYFEGSAISLPTGQFTVNRRQAKTAVATLRSILPKDVEKRTENDQSKEFLTPSGKTPPPEVTWRYTTTGRNRLFKGKWEADFTHTSLLTPHLHQWIAIRIDALLLRVRDIVCYHSTTTPPIYFKISYFDTYGWDSLASTSPFCT